jgi:isopentenyldiphosphate isomerase
MHYNSYMKIQISSSLHKPMRQRFKLLLAQAQELPPVGSRPLTFCGRVCGWVLKEAIPELLTIDGVSCDGDAVHIGEMRLPTAQANRLLERIANKLNEAGFVKAWRGELLDVFAEGRCLGAIERGAVRPLGVLTQAVHLNAWTPEGRLWVQKRAAHKSTNPNMWDTLVGGLVSAQEDLDVSLLRESEEEAGLYAKDLHALEPMRLITRMHRRLPEGYQVENAWVNDCVLDHDVQPQNQDGEVSEIRHISVEEYWEMSVAGEFTLEAELVSLDSICHRASIPDTIA